MAEHSAVNLIFLDRETILRNGYEIVYMPEHHRADSSGCVYEHIIVAEEKLGRLLKSDECVHHLNEVRNDNRSDNIIVFKTRADHTAFHNGCDIELDGDVYVAKAHHNNICPNCGSKKDNHAKLCFKCNNILKRKIERPSKEYLYELITTRTFIDIGNMYGVSDNAIRKWCKNYDLPYRQNKIKELKY